MHPQLYWLLPIPIHHQNIKSPSSFYLVPQFPSHQHLSQFQSPSFIDTHGQNPAQNLSIPCNMARQRRHFKRRRENQLNKCYKCPYPNCQKDYASDLALNLHMKNKHRGGNKKQRDHAAKLILKSELQGRPAPKCDVELPPGYIEANKIRLLLETECEYSSRIKLE